MKVDEKTPWRCFRCGEKATTEFTAIPFHPGSPSCERCIVELQVDHARERVAALPELERRLEELGGPILVQICGYVSWMQTGDKAQFGDFCELENGHDGFHVVATSR